jgi:hypothetical protein
MVVRLWRGHAHDLIGDAVGFSLVRIIGLANAQFGLKDSRTPDERLP